MSALDELNALLRAGTEAGHACCALYSQGPVGSKATAWCANCEATGERLRQHCSPRLPAPASPLARRHRVSK